MDMSNDATAPEHALGFLAGPATVLLIRFGLSRCPADRIRNSISYELRSILLVHPNDIEPLQGV